MESADTAIAEYRITGTLVSTGERVSLAGAMAVTSKDELILISRYRDARNPHPSRRGVASVSAGD